MDDIQNQLQEISLAVAIRVLTRILAVQVAVQTDRLVTVATKPIYLTLLTVALLVSHVPTTWQIASNASIQIVAS